MLHGFCYYFFSLQIALYVSVCIVSCGQFITDTSLTSRPDSDAQGVMVGTTTMVVSHSWRDFKIVANLSVLTFYFRNSYHEQKNKTKN